ncbi:MAG: hypothetical protein OSJ43_05540 [Oscillospiraceae bacterium]|nr:hypothetical protein [Oscillospiraceae bacterium]
MPKNSNNVVSDLDTKTSAEAPVTPVASDKPRNETATNFVYIGPSLPGAKLMNNTVISGTRKEISEYYKDVIEQYPNVDKLIVPVDKLSESRAKISAGGNVLSKYYNDLLIQVKKGAVE